MPTPVLPNVVKLKKSGDKYRVTIFDGSTVDYPTLDSAIEAAEEALRAILHAMKGPMVGIIDFE